MRRLEVLALLLAGQAFGDVVRADEGRPECVGVEAIVRYGAGGYDHWVRVSNGCEQPVACRVASDVNPEPQSIELRPRSHTEVLTFRGSPARTFTPRVACELRQ